jgi:lambda family phage portal protein
MSENAAVDRLNALVSKLVAAIRPPPNVSVSEWATQNRVLSPEASAEQGRWRNSRTPYLVEIMDAFSDPRIHHIVVVASSQVGKSEFENNVIGRTIDVDPGSILFIHPQMTDANSPSSDIHDNADILRQRSRMLYMSAPVATSAINTNRTKIVGTGLTLKATVDRNVLGLSPEKAKEWQSKTEAEFRLWAENRRSCDAMGLNDFYGLQQLALKSWLMSGDVFAVVKIRDPDKLHPYGLRLHLVEADRVSTPDKLGGMLDGLGYTEGTNPNTGNKIYDGVEVDSSGMIVAYHVRNTYPHEWRNDITKWQRVESVGATTGLPQILHIMESERPDQYRGVPLIAPIIEPLLQLRRYTESELLAALVQSFFTAWIVTDTPKNAIPFDETGSGDLGGVPVDNPKADNASHSPNEYEMGPGTVAHLGKGEDIKFGNPNIPTAGFDTFVKTLCKLMGGAIEMPYELLLKEFNASYSASRASLLEAWEGIKMRRAWLVGSFCQPVYEIWLSEAVARGRVIAPGFFDDPLVRAAWCGARWIGPVQGTLDPKKEVEAAVLQTHHGFRTHEQVTRELGGGDWEDNVAELAHENEQLKAAGSEGVIETTESVTTQGGKENAESTE